MKTGNYTLKINFIGEAGADLGGTETGTFHHIFQQF